MSSMSQRLEKNSWNLASIILDVAFCISFLVEKFFLIFNFCCLLFLVGAFLEKRVDYSHGFSSVFIFDTPEVTKIVRQVVQNFMVPN